MAHPELIIFDWDGTLIDSSGHIVEAVQAAIEATGLPQRDDEAIRQIIGLGMAEAMSALYPDAPAEAQQRLARYYRESFTRAIAAQPAPLYPGAKNVLEQLEGAGHLLAIATGKSRSGLHADLRASGLEHRFVASRTVDECGSKPSPAMVEALLDEFALPPQDALMVGDTIFDLQMARAAGVPAVGVTWGVHGSDQLREAEPAHLVDTFGELSGVVERWRARPNVRS